MSSSLTILDALSSAHAAARSGHATTATATDGAASNRSSGGGARGGAADHAAAGGWHVSLSPRALFNALKPPTPKSSTRAGRRRSGGGAASHARRVSGGGEVHARRISGGGEAASPGGPQARRGSDAPSLGADCGVVAGVGEGVRRVMDAPAEAQGMSCVQLLLQPPPAGSVGSGGGVGGEASRLSGLGPVPAEVAPLPMAVPDVPKEGVSVHQLWPQLVLELALRGFVSREEEDEEDDT